MNKQFVYPEVSGDSARVLIQKRILNNAGNGRESVMYFPDINSGQLVPLSSIYKSSGEWLPRSVRARECVVTAYIPLEHIIVVNSKSILRYLDNDADNKWVVVQLTSTGMSPTDYHVVRGPGGFYKYVRGTDTFDLTLRRVVFDAYV